MQPPTTLSNVPLEPPPRLAYTSPHLPAPRHYSGAGSHHCSQTAASPNATVASQ